jgi:uncharacterized membrane protein
MANNGITVSEVNAFAEKIKTLLENAEADRKTVIALRALLGGSAGRAIALGGRRGARRGRANAEAVKGKVLDAVKRAKGGARLGELVEDTGIGRATIQRALQKLRDAGSVKLVGQKRLAKYYAA